MKKIWMEINRENMLHNISVIEGLKDNRQKLIAVLKANAYGHGIEEVINIIDKKVDMYSASTLEECEEACKYTKKKILLMSPLCSIEDFINNKNREQIVLSIDSIEMLDFIDSNIEYKVHLCIDTTNHRIGIKTMDLENTIREIKKKLPKVHIEGIYTHLHNTSNKEETISQIKDFISTTKKVDLNNDILCHCLASSSITKDFYRELAQDSNAVRIGNLIYGFGTTEHKLKETFKFKAKILNKHSIKKGEKIGFGSNYTIAEKDTEVGIIYAGHYLGTNICRETKNTLNLTFVKNIGKTLIERPIVFDNKSNPIKIIGAVSMNSLVVEIGKANIDNIIIKMSPILADSNIPKIII